MARGAPRVGVLQEEFSVAAGSVDCCRALRRAYPVSLLLDGARGFHDRWEPSPLLAVEPILESRWRGASAGRDSDPLGRLARRIAARRKRGGTAETGMAAVLAYDLFRASGCHRDDEGLAELVVFRVDRSVCFLSEGNVRYTLRTDGERTGVRAVVEGDREVLGCGRTPLDDEITPARSSGAPVSSLPRESYLRAVEQIRERIAAGDVYQANLCQRLSTSYRGDELELYRGLVADVPAPRSAFVSTADFALASISPETFLRLRAPDRIATLPIKGTRPRGLCATADRAAARELLASPKDHAELLMIVDLERNDLGRVCRPGTVCVPELAALRSYATVHHLVARIEGRLRKGVGLEQVLEATFPGGSITGAPKLRAMEILDRLEPVRRNYFTGSLFWFGDDGSTESSILIRTLVFTGGRALLGAGGGIVADSDPEQEWLESNHKARALSRALGFEPEEAS